VDLTGEWERDLSAVIRGGGAGEVTVLLPSQVGVRVNAGTRLGRVPTASNSGVKPSSTTPTVTRRSPWKSTWRAASGRST
jgi:hypothetical protein